jgi:hypothetical protein
MIWNGTSDSAWYNESANEFTINTAEELSGLAMLVNGGNDFEGKTIKLGQDIALNDTANWENWKTSPPANAWTQIGIFSEKLNRELPFRGIFDGCGFAVSGVYISNSDRYRNGLFGASDGIVKNLGAVNSYIKGKGFVAGLVGYNSGEVSNCYSISTVEGKTDVGGLVGKNDGVINNSYSVVDGLVGDNSGAIINCCCNKSKSTAYMQSKEFVDSLNYYASLLSLNLWVYSAGKYPALSSQTAKPINMEEFFKSGNGTEENPYIINTKKQLENFSWLVNNGVLFSGKTVKLGENIVLNKVLAKVLAKNWMPIGNRVNSFRGTFDGGNFTISGLYINDSDCTDHGLFGYLDKKGTIKNLGIINSYIKGNNYIGGLVGENNGTINNCYFSGTVIAAYSAGGLAGDNEGAIYNSYSAGATVTESSAGGLAGSNGGIISNCYSSSAVTVAEEDAGGLVGDCDYGIIHNSYSCGTVKGKIRTGGLVGKNWSPDIISDSYYDGDVYGKKIKSKGVGKTTAEMQSKKFVDNLNLIAGLISMNAWVYSAGKYPVLSDTPAKSTISSYFASGSGTEADPYIISTKKQLTDFSRLLNSGVNCSDKYFKLGSDIALNDTANWQSWASKPPKSKWTPVGVSREHEFNGIFDGNGFTVSGVYIKPARICQHFQGMFRWVGAKGVIKNLNITDSYINSLTHAYNGGDNSGGLAGSNAGTISNCHFIGIVEGRFHIGGLVGWHSGTISKSSYNGTVKGSANIDGLVGANYGTVSESNFTGNIMKISHN